MASRCRVSANFLGALLPSAGSGAAGSGAAGSGVAGSGAEGSGTVSTGSAKRDDAAVRGAELICSKGSGQVWDA